MPFARKCEMGGSNDFSIEKGKTAQCSAGTAYNRKQSLKQEIVGNWWQDNVGIFSSINLFISYW